ncbi:pectinesterase family protein [Agarivorans sp. QJM3NY_33]|uniref:pectinesterase family protein n=1 Tax=Agarivorans sp. QJM3NY_33 TaxID=3421432 RepID=UPI003D7E04C4
MPNKTTPNHIQQVTVSLQADADFSSIQQALDNAPDDHSPYLIYIANGRYQEKIKVTRANTQLIGESQTHCIVSATMANGMIDSQGRKFATFNSYTLCIDAADVQIRSLSIENGFDFPANAAKAEGDPSKLKHTQAVALALGDNADRVQLIDLDLQSYQDTLYLRAGRCYLSHCRIAGTIDFIFGGGVALIDKCEIVARNREAQHHEQVYGYISAPCTDIKQTHGLVFRHCQLSKEPGVPANSYALGRPWHPTTQFSDGNYADPKAIGHVAFINCELDDHLYGWDKMSGRDIQQNIIWFRPENSRFWEYNNSGAGAKSRDKQRPQLTEQQMQHYQLEHIFGDWRPSLYQANQAE